MIISNNYKKNLYTKILINYRDSFMELIKPKSLIKEIIYNLYFKFFNYTLNNLYLYFYLFSLFILI